MLGLPEGFVKPDDVKSLDFIYERVAQVNEIMSTELDGKNIDDISDRMTDLMELRPAMADIKASAKYYLNFQKAKAIESTDLELQPSKFKMVIDTAVREWQWLFDRCDRTEAALTHYLDECRSLLSKEKEVRRQMI